jgi:hypothetical protein
MQRPWVEGDYPHIAGWLKGNQKQLAVVIEATRRQDYYNPLVVHTTNKGPGALIGALLPGVQKCRELASALTARAMLRVGEGKYDAAWQDLLACHRLGRLVARGATLIELLVGVAIDQIASNADVAYLQSARLNSRQALARLKDLQALPPMPSVADKIDLGERFMFLDSVQMVRRGGVGTLEGLSGGKSEKPTKEELRGLSMIDWAPALRNGNQWYDRMVAALRHKDRAGRKKALDAIERDLREKRMEAMRPENLVQLLKAKFPPDKVADKDVAKEIGTAIGNVLITLLMPATTKVQDAHDRVEQGQRNVRLAFALAAYKSDRGRYPAKLDDLAPKYLATVPDDIFSGKAPIYRRDDDGYLLYSVGPNGKDDEGRWFDDVPPGDDPRVRMPLPPLKEKK